jgi:hypothetical protein
MLVVNPNEEITKRSEEAHVDQNLSLNPPDGILP